MYLKSLVGYLKKMLNRKNKPPKRRPKISILIPFQTKNHRRKKVFDWLLTYWKHELPEAEIIIGHSRSKPFCKTEALNNAAEIATGKVLVILDADAYLPGRIIERCADRILEEKENHLWYVPYRHLYRLNKEITEKIIESNPKNPLRLPSPPPKEYLDDDGQKSTYGHRYGAMIMIFPREALEVIGCFDERFKGWGGEDIALLRALDTLYGKHKTTHNDILHLWHPFIGANYKSRIWKNQDVQFNSRLANKYNKATRHPSEMRHLVHDGCKARHKKKWYSRFTRSSYRAN
jgi:predicted glycosyltransferase involved in capsule biosynthesis